MSQQAAGAAGCCCRPVEGCPCDDPNRPGAVFDASLTSVLMEFDINVDHATRDDVNRIGCPGATCPCTAPAANPGGNPEYGYQSQGRSPDPDLDCTDSQGNPIPCVQGPCPGCFTRTLNASGSSAILRRPTLALGPMQTIAQVPGEYVIGTWSWAPYQAGYCVDQTSGVRVRRFCPFRYLDTLGGTGANIIVDPNGQYVDAITYNYTYGGTGMDIGLMRAVVSASVSYRGTGPYGQQCGYTAVVSVRYRSGAGLADEVGVEDAYYTTGPQQLAWYYFKPCMSASDTMLGTYTLVSPADIDAYEEFQVCGPSYSFDMLRASATSTLTIS